MPKPTAYGKRTVIVNTNRRGMIHEQNGRWLNPTLTGGNLFAPYITMQANDVASDKTHCSHCA